MLAHLALLTNITTKESSNMANNDSTQSTVLEVPEDAIDQLHRKSAQLSAMLTMIIGIGFDAFDANSEAIKQNYLWACSDLACDVEVLALSAGNGL